jgi:CRP-like cAMP-binding protein
MGKVVVNPEASLAARPGDVEPTEKMLGALGVFTSLKKKSPSFAKFPGTCVLRYYRAGEAICRQGEAGGTAFYLLTSADVEALSQQADEGEARADAGSTASRSLQALLKKVRPSATSAPGGASAQPRRLATARLLINVDGRPRVQQRGWLQSLWPSREDRSQVGARPTMIANDGPADIDYNTRQAALYEGEILGEMSCLTRQPRSATVVVDCDCVVLEFLRNILEQMRGDADYRQKADANYRERVLENHLRKLPLFAVLSEKDFQSVRESVELVRLEPGKVIWDEGDASDAVYVVRSGVVQVLQSFPWRLTASSITDWPKLVDALNAPAAARVKALLPEDVQALLTTSDGVEIADETGNAGRVEPSADRSPPDKEKTGAEKGKSAPAKDVKALLAAARSGGGAKREGGDTKPSEKSSSDHTSKGSEPGEGERAKPAAKKDLSAVLAAARGGGGAKRDGAETKPSEKSSSDQMSPGSEPAESERAKPAAKKDISALLAAARGGGGAKREGGETKAKRDEPSPNTPSKVSATADAGTEKVAPKKDLSAILAAARGGQGAPKGKEPGNSAEQKPSPAPLKRQGTAGSAELSEAQKRTLIDALNELAKSGALVADKPLQSNLADVRMQRETAEFMGKPADWTGMQHRRATRVLYHVLFPQLVTPAEPVGSARVMQYLGRGGIFGEIGVVKKQPRSATCVAYAHPRTDAEATEVELVRVPADTIYKLSARSPQLRTEFEKLIVMREKRSEMRSQAPVEAASESRKAEDLGLLQGQNLMLIDLDRCTRCGDCVQACINTHDDGHSRLYLDGPRFGKYLIPSSCRQCRDPVCMIGCPVGSIQQGDDGEIQIREWCIGCGLCAEQCPYDSIQMHDEALVPSESPGWLWCEAGDAAAGESWYGLECKEAKWRVGAAPFQWGIDMFAAVKPRPPGDEASEAPRLYFRFHFRVDSGLRDPAKRFRLQVTSHGSSLEARINGQTLPLTQDPSPKKRSQYVANVGGDKLQPGDNVLAVAVSAPSEFNATLLEARLDSLAAEAENVEVKLVTERAVVCDQCSSLSGDRNACVYACPHEAAMRVDSWDFLASPTGQVARN